MRYLTATAFSYIAPHAGVAPGNLAFEFFCQAVYSGRAFTARNIEIIGGDFAHTGELELKYHPSENRVTVYGRSDGMIHIDLPPHRKGD